MPAYFFKMPRDTWTKDRWEIGQEWLRYRWDECQKGNSADYDEFLSMRKQLLEVPVQADVMKEITQFNGGDT